MSMKKRILSVMLLLALSLQLMLSPTVSSVEYPVTGKTLNEDGEALSKVTVFVHDTASGGLAGKAYTDSLGSFKIDLPYGRYDLVFKKKGYATYTKTVSVAWPGVNLGDMQLSKALKLTITSSSRVANPGKNLALSFTLSNAGEEEEECTFNITSPEGWDVRVTDESGELAELRLPAGSTVSLNIEIAVPQNASGENGIKLTVIGSTIIELPVRIAVEEEETPLLACEFPSKTGKPGSIVNFQVQIHNPFNVRTRFSLAAVFVPEDWEVLIRNTNQELVNEVLLETDQSINLVIEAQVPKNVSEGNYEFTLKVESSYCSDALVLKVSSKGSSVTAAKYVVELKSKYPSQSVNLGTTARYPVTIKNLNQTDEVFELSALSIPPGWQIAFKTSEGQEVWAVLIEANGAETINVEITPSLNSTLGSYLIPIEAKSPRTRGVITLEAIVSGSYNIRIDVLPIYTQIKAGATQTITAKITNTGHSPITNVEIEIISSASGWKIETSPLKLSTLEPNEAKEFKVSIQPPEGTAPGDYLIKIKASSDQISSEEQVIRVTVTPETAWGVYGAAMVAVAIAAIILVLKKFRRK